MKNANRNRIKNTGFYINNQTLTVEALSCRSVPDDWLRFSEAPRLDSLPLSMRGIALKLGIVFTPFNACLSSPW